MYDVTRFLNLLKISSLVVALYHFSEIGRKIPVGRLNKVFAIGSLRKHPFLLRSSPDIINIIGFSFATSNGSFEGHGSTCAPRSFNTCQ